MSVQYPTRDTKYPPNETLAARRLWELATRPEDGVIPADTLFVARWSNGHYGPPETKSFELLTTDNIGPGFTCERRALVPADPHRPLTTDAFTDAATSAYEDYVRTPKMNVGTFRDRIAEAYMDAAEWARTYLAAQEPTDTEVEAAKAVLDAHEYADEPQAIRDALTAAKEARHG